MVLSVAIALGPRRRVSVGLLVNSFEQKGTEATEWTIFVISVDSCSIHPDVLAKTGGTELEFPALARCA